MDERKTEQELRDALPEAEELVKLLFLMINNDEDAAEEWVSENIRTNFALGAFYESFASLAAVGIRGSLGVDEFAPQEGWSITPARYDGGEPGAASRDAGGLVSAALSGETEQLHQLTYELVMAGDEEHQSDVVRELLTLAGDACRAWWGPGAVMGE